ncbi:SDR family NAD(P)-dependent oxidoreductase [Polymorphospora rubra]|uniref:Short-chain dehydrogenase n=1 Tax=Polymorphospora rubra TaxID=338584 RepID=A0A810MRG9_9ACTN|nr:SDR family NAD(P)-dependent oxidoreductase [Polymorphospora rubra]BCJ63522.1 short-chain dehydrogenase [Polymorphospora rubra]
MSESPTTPPRRRWTAADIPDQSGRTVLITGASSGLGLHMTGELARRGARVVMAVRDVAKGERARAALPAADRIEVRHLDLVDLDSVREFAAGIVADGGGHVLVNNAGIGNLPRRLSPQGHERQFATNHLGHFALTGLLLDALTGPDPRVVTVTSSLYPLGTIPFDDLTGERRFSPGRAYINTKLANVLFGLELDRRLRAAGSPVRSLLAHPGMARTAFVNQGPVAVTTMAKAMSWVIGRPTEQGALPLLYAATAPDAPTGMVIGTGPVLRRGGPTPEPVRRPGGDPDLAARLWRTSEQLTAVSPASGLRGR